MSLLDRFSQKDKKLGSWFIEWNWPAFFFGKMWFLYRGMHAYALIFYGVDFVINILIRNVVIMHILYALFPQDTQFGWIVCCVMQIDYLTFLHHLFYGLYGTALYGMFIKKQCVKAGISLDQLNNEEVLDTVLPEPSVLRALGFCFLYGFLYCGIIMWFQWTSLGGKLCALSDTFQHKFHLLLFPKK